MNKDQVSKFIDQLSNESKNSKILKEAIQRILDDRVEDFLREKLKGDDRKLRTYANEVLNQIQSKFAPRPKS